MKFDLVTLASVSAIIAAINAVFFLCVWRINKEHAGVQEWMAATLCFPIAFYLINYTDSSQVVLAQFSANIIGILGAVLLVIGCRKFFQFNNNNVLIALLLFIPFSGFIGYFTFTKPNGELRLLILEMLAITSLFIMLMVSISPRLPKHNKGRTLLGSVCIFVIGLLSLHVHSQLSPQNSLLPVSAYFIDFLIIGTLFAAHYCFTICFIILCNERNQQLLAQTLQAQSLVTPTVTPVEDQECDQLEDLQSSEPMQLENSLLVDQVKPPVEQQPVDDVIRIEPTLTEGPLGQAVIQEQSEPTLAYSEDTSDEIAGCPPELTDDKQPKTDQLLTAQLVNQKSLQRQQKKSTPAQFNQLIDQLPQRLTSLTLDAKNAYQANQPVQLKTQLHQLASIADNIGLEQLADHALQLELSDLGTLDQSNFDHLSHVSQSSLSELQQILVESGEHEKNQNSA